MTLKLVPPRLPTIVPCPPAHRDEAALALSRGLADVNAQLTALRMAALELLMPNVDGELASITERIERLRMLMEVPDAG